MTEFRQDILAVTADRLKLCKTWDSFVDGVEEFLLSSEYKYCHTTNINSLFTSKQPKYQERLIEALKYLDFKLKDKLRIDFSRNYKNELCFEKVKNVVPEKYW